MHGSGAHGMVAAAATSLAWSLAVNLSRRTLLSTLALLLPASAAEAARKHKPAAKPHKLAKAHHKPARRRRLARRHAPAKPASSHS